MKSIIFIAAPAAGKGTQSALLTEKYDYMHISTGDILRSAISDGTALGNEVKNIMEKGELVSDDIMISLIRNVVEKNIGKSFIFDGFPRTIFQAQALTNILEENKIDYKVIYLRVDKETAKKRIIGRRTCLCGKTYNVYDTKFCPKKDGICDICGRALEVRKDDNEESFKVRFETFKNNATPLIDYYENKNNLITIDVDKNCEDVFLEIEKEIQND